MKSIIQNTENQLTTTDAFNCNKCSTGQFWAPRLGIQIRNFLTIGA